MKNIHEEVELKKEEIFFRVKNMISIVNSITKIWDAAFVDSKRSRQLESEVEEVLNEADIYLISSDDYIVKHYDEIYVKLGKQSAELKKLFVHKKDSCKHG